MSSPPPPPPRPQLPDDLIAEVLSWLPVKHLMRLRCVCKSWNTLIISDHTFIKLHLHRSALHKPHLLLEWNDSIFTRSFCVTHFSGSRLVENPSIISLPDVTPKRDDIYTVVGSYNGLVCLNGCCDSAYSGLGREEWICFWNPATRLMSEKLGSCRVDNNSFIKYNFGYDHSTNSYKVVKFVTTHLSNNVSIRIYILGDNVWRDIQNFPLLPLHLNCIGLKFWVHLSGTLNWITSRNESASCYNRETITVEQLAILSLGLGTETCTLLSLPKGFDEVPCVLPSIGVLMDCLCFSHDLKKTHFVIWQMKKFGDAESWVQLLKISYQDLQREPLDETPYTHYQLVPLYLYNGDTFILASSGDDDDDDQAILYSKTANTVQRTALTTTTTEKILWFLASEYVESLVSPLRVGSSTTVA
ncbi:F-box/kelch-repeat protein At3g23880-like [Lotus japonicus]|uniref:F-box/kelch-repeat protein At3g23880-like n=1 Tax=Lotus japonicus TaxID=34305 RepID=UPI00258A5FF5|nr:F-box/kelch-repeat protein At3g23880-like [Lotus japonicus]